MTRRRTKQDTNLPPEPSCRYKLIKPKTLNQRDYVSSIVDSDVTICSGPSGSGKSLVALSTAISHMANPNMPHSKIYVTRPMISTSTKDFPWIKGSLIDKLRPWFAPILANLEELIGSKHELEKLLESETICLQAIELMRGFTYKNCFVLITEAQNMTVPQAVMAITRIGENCKMVFEGDTDQKDLRGEEDGLSYLKRKLFHSPDLCGMVNLDSSDILRHPLIGQILEKLDYRGLGSY